jgi:hypothetical protein
MAAHGRLLGTTEVNLQFKHRDSIGQQQATRRKIGTEIFFKNPSLLTSFYRLKFIFIGVLPAARGWHQVVPLLSAAAAVVSGAIVWAWEKIAFFVVGRLAQSCTS